MALDWRTKSLMAPAGPTSPVSPWNSSSTIHSLPALVLNSIRWAPVHAVPSSPCPPSLSSLAQGHSPSMSWLSPCSSFSRLSLVLTPTLAQSSSPSPLTHKMNPLFQFLNKLWAFPLAFISTCFFLFLGDDLFNVHFPTRLKSSGCFCLF